MYRIKNPRLYQAAKDICREMRKSQTRTEKLFWENVRNKRFKGLKFYRQYPIFYEINNRESFVIADFYCFEKKTIIEIDGKIHLYKKNKDRERTQLLSFLGIKIPRFTNEEVENDLETVLSEILNTFKMMDSK
jgi:very-short-patch-repair endonuclease